MPKALCIFGITVAGLLVLIFGLDLAIGVPPFYKSSAMLDIAFIFCAGILGYLSWTAFREQT